MDFQSGDVVQLKSGGMQMTVDSISDGEVYCVWQDPKTMKIETYAFNPSVLRAAQKSSITLSE